MEQNKNQVTDRNGRRIPVRRLEARQPEVELGTPTAEESTAASEPTEGPSRVGVSADEVSRPEADGIDWRDMALRLRADMENYRKRQERWAESQVQREKAKVLGGLLDVVDLVEKVAQHATVPQDEPLAMIHTSLLKVLQAEGVEPIAAEQTPFDPACHEAVSMVPAVAGQPAPLWVVAEERRGYRLADMLLRAARVVVAAEK